LDDFIDEFGDKYEFEVENLFVRLQGIGKKGARENYVKQNEGLPGDGVCALFDEPDQKLRLYAIRYGSVAIVIGGGGHKSLTTRTWQEDPILKKHAELMIFNSNQITQKIKSKEIGYSADGGFLEGNLKFEIE